MAAAATTSTATATAAAAVRVMTMVCLCLVFQPFHSLDQLLRLGRLTAEFGYDIICHQQAQVRAVASLDISLTCRLSINIQGTGVEAGSGMVAGIVLRCHRLTLATSWG